MKYRIVQLNNDMYEVQSEVKPGKWDSLTSNHLTLEDAKERLDYIKSFEVKKVIEVIE